MTVARILVVDDRDANRDLISYLLRYFGHEVTTAFDGAGAIRAALADRPDLVVMDLAMPGVDGYTAARLMRSEPALRDVPLVAVSATNANLQTAHAAGFDGFYPLPIDPQEFVTLLEPFLNPAGEAFAAGSDA
jgi:CheY-like chemotaxis protein